MPTGTIQRLYNVRLTLVRTSRENQFTNAYAYALGRRFERTSTSRPGLASVLMAQSSAGSGIFGDGSSDEELELENLTSGEVVTKLEEVGVVECDGDMAHVTQLCVCLGMAEREVCSRPSTSQE